jgi:hypothetical protein
MYLCSTQKTAKKPQHTEFPAKKTPQLPTKTKQINLKQQASTQALNEIKRPIT